MCSGLISGMVIQLLVSSCATGGKEKGRAYYLGIRSVFVFCHVVLCLHSICYRLFFQILYLQEGTQLSHQSKTSFYFITLKSIAQSKKRLATPRIEWTNEWANEWLTDWINKWIDLHSAYTYFRKGCFSDACFIDRSASCLLNLWLLCSSCYPTSSPTTRANVYFFMIWFSPGVHLARKVINAFIYSKHDALRSVYETRIMHYASLEQLYLK